MKHWVTSWTVERCQGCLAFKLYNMHALCTLCINLPPFRSLILRWLGFTLPNHSVILGGANNNPSGHRTRPFASYPHFRDWLWKSSKRRWANLAVSACIYAKVYLVYLKVLENMPLIHMDDRMKALPPCEQDFVIRLGMFVEWSNTVHQCPSCFHMAHTIVGLELKVMLHVSVLSRASDFRTLWNGTA